MGGCWGPLYGSFLRPLRTGEGSKGMAVKRRQEVEDMRTSFSRFFLEVIFTWTAVKIIM